MQKAWRPYGSQPIDHEQKPASSQHQLPLVTCTGIYPSKNIHYSDLSKQLDANRRCVLQLKPLLKHQAVIATRLTLYSLLCQFNCACLQKHTPAAHNSSIPSTTHPRFTVKLYVHPVFQSPTRAMQASIQPASRMQFPCRYCRCTQAAYRIT